MRFQFTHERSVRAPTATRRRIRASSRPRSFKALSLLPLVLAGNHLHRNRAVPLLCVYMNVCARASSFIGSRVHAHTRDDGGDSRGQARRRRRLARSSPTTATTTVNEIVGSVSANYRAVPGVRGASLRSYLPPCVVARKRVAAKRARLLRPEGRAPFRALRTVLMSSILDAADVKKRR